MYEVIETARWLVKSGYPFDWFTPEVPAPSHLVVPLAREWWKKDKAENPVELLSLEDYVANVLDSGATWSLYEFDTDSDAEMQWPIVMLRNGGKEVGVVRQADEYFAHVEFGSGKESFDVVVAWDDLLVVDNLIIRRGGNG
jgi:hypothetical protein